MDQAAIEKLIKADAQIMEILRIIKDWHLPDCWLVAGTLRNLVWNQLSQAEFPSADVDVAFFDPNLSYHASANLAGQLSATFPEFNWEIKNQAWMHLHNFPEETPYMNTLDAVSKYPETCTALACRLNSQNALEFVASHGIADLVQFKVRPTPFFAPETYRYPIYQKRVTQKNWQNKWPEIQIYP